MAETREQRRARMVEALGGAEAGVTTQLPAAHAPSAAPEPRPDPGPSPAPAEEVARPTGLPPPLVGALPSPAPAAALPPYEKETHLLTRGDLDIITVQTEIARAAGVRMRKNGNPSLFVRAGLRLLEDLRRRDPDQWLARIRAVADERTASS